MSSFIGGRVEVQYLKEKQDRWCMLKWYWGNDQLVNFSLLGANNYLLMRLCNLQPKTIFQTLGCRQHGFSPFLHFLFLCRAFSPSPFLNFRTLQALSSAWISEASVRCCWTLCRLQKQQSFRETERGKGPAYYMDNSVQVPEFNELLSFILKTLNKPI